MKHTCWNFLPLSRELNKDFQWISGGDLNSLTEAHGKKGSTKGKVSSILPYFIKNPLDENWMSQGFLNQNLSFLKETCPITGQLVWTSLKEINQQILLFDLNLCGLRTLTFKTSERNVEKTILLDQKSSSHKKIAVS